VAVTAGRPARAINWQACDSVANMMNCLGDYEIHQTHCVASTSALNDACTKICVRTADVRRVTDCSRGLTTPMGQCRAEFGCRHASCRTYVWLNQTARPLVLLWIVFHCRRLEDDYQ